MWWMGIVSKGKPGLRKSRSITLYLFTCSWKHNIVFIHFCMYSDKKNITKVVWYLHVRLQAPFETQVRMPKDVAALNIIEHKFHLSRWRFQHRSWVVKFVQRSSLVQCSNWKLLRWKRTPLHPHSTFPVWLGQQKILPFYAEQAQPLGCFYISSYVTILIHSHLSAQ